MVLHPRLLPSRYFPSLAAAVPGTSLWASTPCIPSLRHHKPVATNWANFIGKILSLFLSCILSSLFLLRANTLPANCTLLLF
uniref:Uncharacterized protein n=1 Tax=Ixodes ricinus TaxID=34613 RepID=A0A147BCD5_IXORI